MNIQIIIYLILTLILIITILNFYKCINKEHFVDMKILDDLSIYVINLKKDTERRKKMEDQLNKYNLNFEIIDAVNGKDLDIEQLKKDNIIKVTDTQYKNGEYGCYLSHYNIWKKFSETNKKFALIFEDDVVLSKDFDIKISKILNELNSKEDSNIDIVYLQTIKSCTRFFDKDYCNKVLEQTENMKKTLLLGYGCCSYIITKNGIDKMLKFSLPIVTQIDVLIHHLHYYNILNVMKSKEPLVEQLEEFSNTQNI